MPSIFSKIIAGDLPAYKIYEDEYTFCFLDIFPVRLGHTLVVPKIEVDYFIDVPEPYYSAVFQTAKKIAPAIQKASKAKRIGTAVIGLEVPHFHYHLIPMEQVSDLSFLKKVNPSTSDLQVMQKSIISHLTNQQ